MEQAEGGELHAALSQTADLPPPVTVHMGGPQLSIWGSATPRVISRSDTRTEGSQWCVRGRGTTCEHHSRRGALIRG